MTAHSYSLRSRVSNPSLSGRSPVQSPLAKTTKSPRKPSSHTAALQLRHVIGTTTSTPGGLSCCQTNGLYAYCAGSVAVLASVGPEDVVSYRYFKARPTAIPVNQTTSYYDSPSASSTPSRRRSYLVGRRGLEDYNSTPGRDWHEEGGSSTWSARERIKTVSSVSISPDGKLLAVGETGYNPRVLLFSTAANMTCDTPLSIMTDHSFGVRNVAFSPNSKYLATLGDVNDGFLYLWQVNTKTGVVRLHSSNKCTTNVCDMTWCGNNVITVGTRHIKVWHAADPSPPSTTRRARIRPDGGVPSPGPSTLQGRNCLLGTFVDATFTAVVAISSDQAAVCADDGHICLLDLRQTGKTELSAIDRAETAVAALSCRHDPLRLVWAGGGGLLEELDLSLLKQNELAQRSDPDPGEEKKRMKMSRQSLLRQSLGLSPPKRANVIALGCIKEKAICVDADGIIRVMRIDTHDLEPDISKMSSHNSVVRGTEGLPTNANLGSFLTWARSGEIRFWNNNGKLLQSQTVDLDDNLDPDDAVANELKVVRYFQTGNFLVTGDQYGVLRLLDAASSDCVKTLRAHSAEINSIDVHVPSSFISTCSRDRMVQIFSLHGHELELLQTSDDHISSVTQVLFSQDGNRLLSCSADRTVVVRDRIEHKRNDGMASVFIPSRTVTLKSAPLSISFVPTQSNVIVVSTMDRHVIKIDLVTGSTINTFKVTDRDTDDTVVLNTIRLGAPSTAKDRCLLAGYSAIDKSIRLYDMDKGVLLGRDSGHTEGISDVLMFEEDAVEGVPPSMTIVSTGLDSTIMIWSTVVVGQPALTPQSELSQAQSFAGDPDKVSNKTSPAFLPPLRKILSKMDVTDFARQTSPTREISPGGLRRKASRLALTTSIEEAEEQRQTRTAYEKQEVSNNRSPSPSSTSLLIVKPKKQRSRSEMNKAVDTRYSNAKRSPSPPGSSTTVPTVSKQNTRANNSRLRRPPSFPSELRTQTLASRRRQSVGAISDSGSMLLATEQACRVLKTYRKKLQASESEIDLDEIETDLEAVLKTIKQKKAVMKENTNDRVEAGRTNLDDEVNEISATLDKTSIS